MLRRLMSRVWRPAPRSGPEGQPSPTEADRRHLRALNEEGRFGAACAFGEIALARSPGDPELLAQTGIAVYRAGDLEHAESLFRQALDRCPAESWIASNLGQCLLARGRFFEARDTLERALRGPFLFEAAHNLAVVSIALGDFERAESLLGQVLASQSEDCEAHFAYADLLLRTGRFEAGWRTFERRMDFPAMRALRDARTAPAWNGQTGEDVVLLVWAEQGLGDTLQFARLAFDLARRHPAMAIVLAVQPPLVRLIGRSASPWPNLTVVNDTRAPAHTHQVPLMSLARHLGARLDADPMPPPYLSADPEESALWKSRLESVSGDRVRVGLVWAGSRRDWLGADQMATDTRRSAGAAVFSRLLGTEGCAFFNLQVGPNQADMADLGCDLIDFTAELADFATTAALVRNLDLVICVDTAMVHLAGALGRPVWMLSRYDCCWRWGRRETTAAWYPSLTAFHQQEPGNWENVIDRVAAALHDFAHSRRLGGA